MAMKKRAQNTTVGTTIAIVLAIALVVFLIWGFSTNWAIFSSSSGAIGGKTNVDIIRNSCESQCNSGFEVEYCDAKKRIIDANGESSSQSCFEFVGECSNPDVTCSAPAPADDGEGDEPQAPADGIG